MDDLEVLLMKDVSLSLKSPGIFFTSLGHDFPQYKLNTISNL